MRRRGIKVSILSVLLPILSPKREQGTAGAGEGPRGRGPQRPPIVGQPAQQSGRYKNTISVKRLKDLIAINRINVIVNSRLIAKKIIV